MTRLACPHCDSTHGTPLAEQRVETYEYWAIYRLNTAGEREWWGRIGTEGPFRFGVPLRRRHHFMTTPALGFNDRLVHVTVRRRIRSKP